MRLEELICRINSSLLGVDRETVTEREIALFSRMSIPFYTPADPIGIIMVGGPGSGKSAAQLKAIELMGCDETTFVKVDPDKVLMNLFDGDNTRYPLVEPVLKTLINNALVGRKNIVFDFTGRDFIMSRKFVERLKQQNYTVAVCIAQLDTETAVQRSEARSKREGRSVDAVYLRKTYQQIKQLCPFYVTYPFFDKVFVFDNNGPTLVQILSFSREEAGAICPSLTLVIPPLPRITAKVTLYNNNGPVEDVTIPVQVEGSRITLGYAHTGLPDWVLRVDKEHNVMVDLNGVQFAFSAHKESMEVWGLMIHVEPSQLSAIPSLPQKDSPYWKGQAPTGLVLHYSIQCNDADELVMFQKLFLDCGRISMVPLPQRIPRCK